VVGIAGKSKAVLSIGTLTAAMGYELFADHAGSDSSSHGRLESALLDKTRRLS
jgi:hypothetical protein